MSSRLQIKRGDCKQSPNITKPTSAIPRAVRWLAGGLLIAFFAIPTQAFAQATCGGNVDITNDGTDINGNFIPDYLLADLPATINWELTPKSGTVNAIVVSQVRFALTCFNNGDSVPCTEGNDGQAGDNTLTPLQYGALTGGTCNATLNGVANGIVTFDLPQATLDTAGCTIDFTTQLQDRGIDGTPDFITPAAAFSGTCLGGALNGTARGSAAVEIVDPAIEVTKTGPDEAKVGDTVTYTIGFTATSDPEVLGECTGSDTLLGDLGVFVDGITRDFDRTVEATDPNPLPNTATITCDVTGSASTVSDFDDHSVSLIDPEITVTKTGAEVAKVGDTVTYTIGFTNTGTSDLENCTGSDTLLGDLGVFEDGITRDFDRTVEATDPDPLPNTATITCDVVGFDNTASDDADHSVDLIDPEITVTKTGPDEAKVGDTVTYTIGFTNTGTSDLENCTGSDTLLGDLGVFEDGITRDFDRTVEATDPDPLPNTATITCDVVGFDNTASDDADHSVDLFTVEADMTKICRPDPVTVGETIYWEITIDNTGDKAIDCLVDDATANLTDEPLSVAAGESDSVIASRLVVAGDAPSISNTATASCSVDGYDNTLDLGPADADCEVIVVNEICRTPGFWGTHAGTEKSRSTNLTQLVIDAAGGTLLICGRDIDSTDFTVNSAVEAMCVSPRGSQQRQLARQLTAAALNCVISGGGADCTGTSIESLFAEANAACEANEGNLSGYIYDIDAFNNNEICHERELSESDVFDGVSPLPGPAGSSRACNTATSNSVFVVPAN